MLNIFLDTNICFDLLSGREPFFSTCEFLIECAERKTVLFHTSESVICTLLYLSASNNLKNSDKLVESFTRVCEILPSSKKIITKAFSSKFKDKEDAILYHIALHHNLDYFITRNISDFNHQENSLPAIDPLSFQKIIQFTSTKSL